MSKQLIDATDKCVLTSPVLEQMPGWMFIKNLEFKYTATTLRSAHLCGFKTQHDKYGRTDYELKCKASESAIFFQEQDRQVITEDREISFLQLNQYADEQVHVFLTKKIPLKNFCGSIIGVCGIVKEIENHAVTKAILELVNLGEIDPILGLNKKNFLLDDGNFFSALSEKESEMMFYFIRGFSSKEISSSMRLSTRSIEATLEHLKYKFNCSSLKDLYNYCLTNQAHKTIPPMLLQRCINKNKALEYRENNKPVIKIPKRQKECINLLLTGATSAEIAQTLNISPRTIESYIEVLKSKFLARNKAELIVKLCRYYQSNIL